MNSPFSLPISNEHIYAASIKESGVYAFSISARCSSSKQIQKDEDQNLRVEIDGLSFREIPAEKNETKFNNSAAWNGSEQKGLLKTITFVTYFQKGEHAFHFYGENDPTLEDIQMYHFPDSENILFPLNVQAEDGDRRPWYTFVFVKLPVMSTKTEGIVRWHKLDGDDVKIVVDGTIEKNKSSIFRKDWIWKSSPLDVIYGEKTCSYEKELSLLEGIHYIDVYADRTPTLKSVFFNIGKIERKRIPTVEDPKWTGDFHDDSDQIILARAIFGEARELAYPDDARIAVGWCMRNRIEDSKNRWSKNYCDVITQPSQFSAFNPGDVNRPYVEDPLFTGIDLDTAQWKRCYEIAGKVILDLVQDLTHGANHYYDDSLDQPFWATPENHSITIENSFKTHKLIFHKL